MGTPMIWEGKPLMRFGKPAMGLDCCCDEAILCGSCYIPSQLQLTITEECVEGHTSPCGLSGIDVTLEYTDTPYDIALDFYANCDFAPYWNNDPNVKEHVWEATVECGNTIRIQFACVGGAPDGCRFGLVMFKDGGSRYGAAGQYAGSKFDPRSSGYLYILSDDLVSWEPFAVENITLGWSGWGFDCEPEVFEEVCNPECGDDLLGMGMCNLYAHVREVNPLP